MTEKNISQSVEIFDYTERSENGGDTRYHAANREREVLLRYLLERLNMETGHLSDKQTVRK